MLDDPPGHRIPGVLGQLVPGEGSDQRAHTSRTEGGQQEAARDLQGTIEALDHHADLK
jgi:hypothetical protein